MDLLLISCVVYVYISGYQICQNAGYKFCCERFIRVWLSKSGVFNKFCCFDFETVCAWIEVSFCFDEVDK